MTTERKTSDVASDRATFSADTTTRARVTASIVLHSDLSGLGPPDRAHFALLEVNGHEIPYAASEAAS
jgi:hypothetical protein